MEKINITVLGNSGVGKSSLLKRYLKGVFTENSRKQTFATNYKKTVEVQGQEVTIWFWDTAGQEVYRSLIKTYFRIADGILLIYGMNNYASCKMLRNWLSDVRDLNDTAEIIVVGNKNDVSTEISEDGIKFVKRLVEGENLEHAEASAKTGENVDEIFQYLTQKVLVAKGMLACCEPPDSIIFNSSEIRGSPRDDADGVAETGCRRRIPENGELTSNSRSRSVIHLQNDAQNNNNNGGGCWC